MRKILLLFLILLPGYAGAALLLLPRADSIGGEDVFAQRVLLKAKADYATTHWSLAFDGFFEGNVADSKWANSRPNRGYVNEAYVEFKSSNLFFKVGQHSLRWSDMWLIPSLDVWTARRFNRVYWDPFVDQMEHSTGLSLTFVGPEWAWDLAVFPKVSQHRLPEPIPNYEPEDAPISGGARLKFTPDQFNLSMLAARRNWETWIGAQPTYALETAVLKAEFGLISYDEKDPRFSNREQSFFSIGLDYFSGPWTITPQTTFSRVDEIGGGLDYSENLYYLSAVWQKTRHEIMGQIFSGSFNAELFLHLSYSYNYRNKFNLTGFVQNYDGDQGSLHRLFKDLTGGQVLGARLEVPLSF